MPAWKLITNHGAVLILIAQHGQITVREIAHTLGLTERLIHRIIAELAADGYLSKQRVGRANCYRVHLDMPLLRPVFQEVTVGEVLQGMRVVPHAPMDALARQSRNAAAEIKPNVRLEWPDATADTPHQDRLLAEIVCARARLLCEKTRQVRETSRRMRTERAKLTSSPPERSPHTSAQKDLSRG